MKKIFAFIICAALLLTTVVAFVGCGGATAAEVTTSLFLEADMKKELSEFLTANPDRTSQTKKAAVEKDGEEKASEWLETRLSDYLGTDNVDRAKFSSSTTYGDDFESYNVVGTVYADPSKNPDGYRVVIGANYDNKYATVSLASGQYTGNYFLGTTAEGAMANGSGVATVLALAKYFASDSVRSRLTVDVDFAFYGMGCINDAGSKKYLANLGGKAQSKLLLAVNVNSLGGDKLFSYFDETETKHGEFILGAADDAGVGAAISQPPAFKADLAYQGTEGGLPYMPTALMSDAYTFFGAYNIFALTSGSDNTFFLYNRESEGSDNIADTAADTLANFERIRPDYARQMAVAAETVATAVLKDGFADAMLESKQGVGGYDWLTYPLAGYLTVAVLSLIAVVIIVVIVRNFEKKHKDDPEIKRNVKVAVFGMDFEKPEKDDVFVDIRSTDPFADAFDPFDGDGGDKEDRDGDDKEK